MYIRVNLLPQDLRPKTTLIQFDTKAVLLVLVIVAVVVLGGFSVYIQRTLAVQNARAEKLRREQASLKDTVELQKEVDALRQKVAERVEIVRQLTADSNVRFDMLKHINGIIPENLWLLGIEEMAKADRTAFTLEGMTYAKKDISRFLDGLQHYKQFSAVALESITPSPLEVRDAYQFSVRVELMGAAPKAAEKGEKKPAPEETAPAAAKK